MGHNDPIYISSVGEDRPHTMIKFTDHIYKVIQWYRVRLPRLPGDKAEFKHYDHKLDSSLSRSRRVLLELALCNPWDYFCTFTQDGEKRSRDNLVEFHEDLTQFIRDQRKKGFLIKFVFVPETHEDGSWHVHGLLSGLPESELELFRDMDKRGYRSAKGRRLPKKLRESQFMNWTSYQSKFGFCSLGKIRNPVASAFYITKYITKESDRMVCEVRLQSYWSARGLNHAEKHLDFFGRDLFVDSLLTNKYEFCRTGMTHADQNLDWTFGMEFVDFKDLRPLDIAAFDVVQEVEDYCQYEQLILSM